jgi:hypothetical protein
MEARAEEDKAADIQQRLEELKQATQVCIPKGLGCVPPTACCHGYYKGCYIDHRPDLRLAFS